MMEFILCASRNKEYFEEAEAKKLSQPNKTSVPSVTERNIAE
jgi:hypothetical protein